MKVKITIIMLIVLMVSSAFAFDGQRKGFVLGGGLGFSPTFKWEAEMIGYDYANNMFMRKFNETNAGIGMNLMIGFGWDEKNMIVYDINFAGGDSDFYNQFIAQQYNGISWYHYFGNGMTSQFFSTVGLGLYNFDGENMSGFDAGFGILLGGGYEFSRHWQVGLYLSAGKTTLRSVDFNHTHLNILISGVAF